MSKWQVRITPVAYEDLQAIKAYIADELCNPDAADRIVDRIVSSYEQLSDFPMRGKDAALMLGIETNYRVLVCESYVIFYKVEAEYVSVYRIIYGKRDFLTVLFDLLPEE